jgi:NADH-quinone oxidoreductase subunit E
MESVGAMLGMPLIRVLEVATFYTMFHLEPVGTKAHVQVCGTTPCMLRGSGELIDVCRRRIHERPHHVSANGASHGRKSSASARASTLPMVQIGKDNYEDLTRTRLKSCWTRSRVASGRGRARRTSANPRSPSAG